MAETPEIYGLDVCKRIYRHLEKNKRAGVHLTALQGARRAAKTYTTCQFLLVQMLTEGDECIIASMTDAQSRKGAYADCKTILRTMPEGVSQYFEVFKSPRRIECQTTIDGKSGWMEFASFADPETAKGGACDWVFINEANKFTKQQYLDLAANARKGVIIDYNPNQHFWVEELDVEPLQCHWWYNRQHLTQAQLDWFAQLKAAVERPEATEADWFYYLVYYRGEYASISGDIFTPANIHIADRSAVPWSELKNPLVFCDPSALRGADFFPAVLTAVDSKGDMWVLEMTSFNNISKEERLRDIVRMAASMDRVKIFVEINGLVGIEFHDFCKASKVPVVGWCSRGNKFDRIVSHYQELTHNVHFVDTANTKSFLAQVYDFGEKCEHDDNIDAVNSAWMAHKL